MMYRNWAGSRLLTSGTPTQPPAAPTGLSATLASNTKDQDKLNDRLADTETRLRAQYAALDTKMATLNALSAYMTQQIAAWNKKNSDI